jgi:hypothetical protein
MLDPCDDPGTPPPDVKLLDERTIERAWGWVFFFVNCELEDGGDCPIMIDRNTGDMLAPGTIHEPEHYIELYEKGKLRPNPSALNFPPLLW